MLTLCGTVKSSATEQRGPAESRCNGASHLLPLFILRAKWLLFSLTLNVCNVQFCIATHCMTQPVSLIFSSMRNVKTWNTCHANRKVVPPDPLAGYGIKSEGLIEWWHNFERGWQWQKKSHKKRQGYHILYWALLSSTVLARFSLLIGLVMQHRHVKITYHSIIVEWINVV